MFNSWKKRVFQSCSVLVFVLICFAFFGVFPCPLQCWNIVLKQLCGLWLLLQSFSFFHCVEPSVNRFSWIQTKSKGCDLGPVLAVKSSGSKSLAYIQSHGQWAWACPDVDLPHCSQLSSCLDGILSCGSPPPLELSKQACSPYFLKEFCWRKHLSFLFLGIADPFACQLCCDLNAAVDAPLRHARTMHLFHSSGICQKYLILLQYRDVISITFVLEHFSVATIENKTTTFEVELSFKWSIALNVLLAGKIITSANWCNFDCYWWILFIRLCVCSFYLPLQHNIEEKHIFISCISFCQPEVFPTGRC